MCNAIHSSDFALIDWRFRFSKHIDSFSLLVNQFTFIDILFQLGFVFYHQKVCSWYFISSNTSRPLHASSFPRWWLGIEFSSKLWFSLSVERIWFSFLGHKLELLIGFILWCYLWWHCNIEAELTSNQSKGCVTCAHPHTGNRFLFCSISSTQKSSFSTCLLL